MADLIAEEDRMKTQAHRQSKRINELKSKLLFQNEHCEELRKAHSKISALMSIFEERHKRMEAQSLVIFQWNIMYSTKTNHFTKNEMNVCSEKEEMRSFRKLRERLLGMNRNNVNGKKSTKSEQLHTECAESRKHDEQDLAFIQSNDQKIEELIFDKMQRFGLRLNTGDQDKHKLADSMNIASPDSDGIHVAENNRARKESGKNVGEDTDHQMVDAMEQEGDGQRDKQELET